jgi:hypothetical protein
MNSKQKIQDRNTFENLCKELWKIIVKHGNIPPWKRDELCQEHEQLTEKQFCFLANFIRKGLPDIIQELNEFNQAMAYLRRLGAWRAKYASSNDIVSELLNSEKLDEVHRRAKWLDEWKSKHGITVF